MTCPDDGKTKVTVEVDLSKLEVTKPEGHDPKIQLTDDIGLMMAYPHFGTVNAMQMYNAKEGSQIEQMFQMISECIYQIWQGEEVFDAMDYSDEDKKTFLDSLSHDQFERIQDFFNTMPTVKHEIEVTNPKTKKKSKITLQGMNDFF